jgi:N-acetylneuraminate lyase
MRERIEGLIAAPHTPMDPAGDVCLETIDRQAELLGRNGVIGAFVCGTTGEGLSLTIDERRAVVERWVAAAPEGFRVIVHVGHICLRDSRGLAAHAADVGASGIGAMGHCFFRPRNIGELVDSCATVAEAAPGLPFYYYHIPSMTGVSFPMVEFLQRASERIPSLAGVKYTHEDLMDYGRCLHVDGGRFDVLFGRDEILLSALALGARGAIGSTYNFAAPLYHRIIEAFGSGDLAAARADQFKAMQIVQAIFRDRPGLAASKAVMKMIGLDCGPVRPPLLSLTDRQQAELRDELERIGLFDFCCK